MKIKSFIFVSATAFLLMWAMQACRHETIGDPNARICFERDIQPIFNSKCAMSGCHDASTAAEGYALNNYKNIVAEGLVKGKPNKSDLYEEIADNTMPPKGYTKLSAVEKQLIYDWIAEGAKNGINCANVCDSAQSGFAAVIQPMMNKYCVGCHGATNASAGVILSDHAGTSNSVYKGLLNSIEHVGSDPMPFGGSKLSPCQINQVKNWIQRGTPND